MNCEELRQLLPDIVDGTLPATMVSEADAALQECPDCQQELDIVRQIRGLMVKLQAENANLRVPAGFENRLLARIQQQRGGLELFDLSSKAFADWLIELLNLIGGLLDPGSAFAGSNPQPAL